MGRKRVFGRLGGRTASVRERAGGLPRGLDVGDPGLLSCELATTLVVAIPIHA